MAVTFTQKAADRISRAVKWVEQQIRTSGNGEGTVTPRSIEPTYVLTTSGTATSGMYPGKVVLYSAADAAWQEYSTCKILPANGETLTNNTRYAARYTGRSSGGDGVFTVLQGGGGGVKVEDYDSSPSYSSIQTIRFNSVDGFNITNPSTGVVLVGQNAAGATSWGLVTSGTQTFGGNKTFNGTVSLGQNVTLKTNSLYAAFDHLFISGGQYASNMVAYFDSTFSVLRLNSTSGSKYVYLVAEDSSSYYGINGLTGSTGTLKSNAIVTGGIITNLGTISVQSSSWMGF